MLNENEKIPRFLVLIQFKIKWSTFFKIKQFDIIKRQNHKEKMSILRKKSLKVL